MGAGGVIQNHSEIRGAVGPGTDHYSRLPIPCQQRVDEICGKGPADWTDEDSKFMHAMAVVGAA